MGRFDCKPLKYATALISEQTSDLPTISQEFCSQEKRRPQIEFTFIEI